MDRTSDSLWLGVILSDTGEVSFDEAQAALRLEYHIGRAVSMYPDAGFVNIVTYLKNVQFAKVVFAIAQACGYGRMGIASPQSLHLLRQLSADCVILSDEKGDDMSHFISLIDTFVEVGSCGVESDEAVAWSAMGNATSLNACVVVASS